ncbi:YadA-like family protein [uncultured Megasphaera sp.]|uniref:YadA-like family protein n=1 Tax=uncultured Megasphaera sp. TaxID=165188 RepID=UPI00261AD2D3|nr:YadA-like family protein [uncultured Megasphaera sp.]
MYWVRDGYTIKYEADKRYPGAQNANIIKAYKTSSNTSDKGLLKSNQIMIESAGISTLTGVDLDDVSGGTYVGATNSGSTSTPSSFNYMIKDDNGTYVDAGNTNFSKRFKAATKNTDGTYSYKGEVVANDNLYVVDNKVGIFLTSRGKVYTGKVFGANNEVLMTTKSDAGTMYSYWGADTPDPNTKLADMTIGQFNQALEKVNNNSKAVAGDTIKEIKTTAKTDGGTIDLVRRGRYNSATGQYDGEYTVGNGITITSHGGTKGEDVKINFSNDNGKTGFDVVAGSKVRAIGTKDATTGLRINGVDYTIKTGDLWTAQAGGKDVNAVKQKVNFVGSDHITVTGTDGQIQFKATGLADTGLTNITEGGKTIINNLAKEAVKVVKGTNTTVTEGLSEDGKTKTYAVNVDNAAIQAATDVTGENGISVTSAVENGVKKYTVSAKLSNNFAIDQATGNIDLAPSISVGKTNPVTINGNTGEITGLSNKTTTAANFADGSGRAATEEQLEEVNSKATAAKTTVTAGKNIAVNGTSDENGSAYTVALADDVSLGNNAIQLKGTDGSISAKSGGAQLAFNNSGLTVSQAKNGLTNETRIDGATITVDGGAGNQTIINGSTAHIGSVLVNGGGGTATITGLTNKTTDYTGFANGSGRAATEEQLKEVDSKAAAAKTTVTNGKNITVNEAKAADGSSTYTVGLATDVTLGDNAIKLNGSDGSISAKSGGAQLAFNNSGLTVSQAKNGLTNETRIDGATITVDGGAGNQTTIKGSTARIGSVLVNGGGGTATISGLTNQTTKYDGFANGSGRAATEEQLKEVAGQAGEAIATAGKGWNLTTNKGTATNIAPGGTVDFSSSNDNLLISNAGADLSFSLSDNLDLTNNKDKKGSVKVGENTTLTDELLQVGKDVSLTASALKVGASSLTTDALVVGGLTYISSSGLNANNRVISNVAAGIADTDAVNVGQLKSAISGSQISIKAGEGIIVEKTGNEYRIKTNIEGLSNEHGTVHVSTDSDPSVVPQSTSTESGTVTPAPAKRFGTMLLTEMATTTENADATTNEIAEKTTIDDGGKLHVKYSSNEVLIEAEDGKKANVNDGGSMKVVGCDNIDTKIIHDNENKVHTLFAGLKEDVTVDSLTARNGDTITIHSKVDMDNKKITNLADGEIAEGSKDAVNGGQLYNTNQAVIANAENINSLSHSLNKLDSRINRVGAGAAALAALHPLDFDPDNKWDFAAGYGNYAGANAVAIGTYYRPNENTMFSIGGSFGGGENMINAGVSFKLGSGGSGITTSKTVMAKKIKEQDELLKAQDAKMKEQDEKIAKLEALVAQQGEMIQQALGKK